MNAIGLYRAGRWMYVHHIPFFPKMIKGITYLLFNSVVPYTAEIGKGSKFAYGGIGCVVHSRAIIGKRVIIGQNSTIGRSLDPEDFPSIGDDVYISAGARIIGRIHVGNNVIIGANAVVNKDVEDNCIVAGVPAKLIRKIDVPIWNLLKNISFKENAGNVGGVKTPYSNSVRDRYTLQWCYPGSLSVQKRGGASNAA